MIKTHKCVVVTPAGRKRYIEILFQYILKERSFIDEYRIWMNTNNKEDIEYFHYLANTFDFVKLDFSADNFYAKGQNKAIHKFFPNCTDKDTIYIRLDDDIVWLENDFIKKIYEFRENNPQYFLVYGNIINNAIIDHIKQRFGCYENSDFLRSHRFGYHCTDATGWNNADVALFKHKQFIEDIKSNKLDTHKFSKWICFYYERVSINCISWFGKDFSVFNGDVGEDEEQWLSVDKPRELSIPNCVYGGALCSHFAFYTQRGLLDRSQILDEYKKML